MNRPRRVLVVCKGNHCRSPIAAVIIAERSGGTLEVRSAGDPRLACRQARPSPGGGGRRRLRLRPHRAPGLLPWTRTFSWADDLIAVDDETALAVEALAGPGRPVSVLGEGITDPWGGGPGDFARTVLKIQEVTGMPPTV